MNTNSTALFYLGQAVTRHMKQRGQGKIINIASIMTKMARHHVGAYVTAKAAVGGLTRAMTAEWAGYGINCNAIGPGYISTELTQPLFEDKAFSDWLIAQTPAVAGVRLTIWLAPLFIFPLLPLTSCMGRFSMLMVV